MSKALYIFLIALTLLPPKAEAQLNVCDEVNDVRERVFCENDDLKALRDEMEGLIFNIKNYGDKEGKSALAGKEGEWQADQESCNNNVGCLRNIFKRGIRNARRISEPKHNYDTPPQIPPHITEGWPNDEVMADGYAVILPETIVLARSGMDRRLPRTIACVLPFKAMLHSANQERSGATSARYYTSRIVTRFIAKHDFYLELGDKNDKKIRHNIRQGQIIDGFGDALSGEYIRLDGIVYSSPVLSDALKKDAREVSKNIPNAEQWIYINCANGPRAWIFSEDLCTKVTNDKPSCINGVHQIELQYADLENVATRNLSDEEVEALARRHAKPFQLRKSVVPGVCHMGFCSFTHVDLVMPLALSGEGIVYKIMQRGETIKAPEQADGSSDYDSIKEPRVFKSDFRTLFTYCSRAYPTIFWRTDGTHEDIKENTFIIYELKPDTSEDEHYQVIAMIDLYLKICANNALDDNNNSNEPLESYAKRIGYHSKWPETAHYEKFNKFSDVLRHIGKDQRFVFIQPEN